MKGKLNTDLGQVLISPEVVAKYASETAYECFGIVGMAMVSMKDGLVRLLKRDSSTKGINVIIDEDNEITIDFHIIVVYGVSIATVTENLIQNVKYRVEKFTGMSVEKINIYVEGVRIVDQNVFEKCFLQIGACRLQEWFFKHALEKESERCQKRQLMI